MNVALPAPVGRFDRCGRSGPGVAEIEPLERTRRLVENEAQLHVHNGQGHLQLVDALLDALARRSGTTMSTPTRRPES